MQLLIHNLRVLGVEEKTQHFFDGGRVYYYAMKIYQMKPNEAQPIKLMILDNQMPLLQGIDVIKKIRSHIMKANMNRRVAIQEPIFMLVSSFMTPHLRSHLRDINIREGVDKPINTE
jgi:CheY-like chemotaxis protein